MRHIVLTHLDFDHAGGLDDFPRATVHMLRREHDAAQAQRTWLDRQRYRPVQWGSRARWQVYDGAQGDSWQGLQCVRALHGITDDIVLVPLPGHTLGHAGVAVRSGAGWLLMAGDAYFHHREMNEQPWCTPGLRMYQTLMDKDRAARLENQVKLRALKAKHGSELEIVSAHDPTEFERVSGRSMHLPPEEA